MTTGWSRRIGWGEEVLDHVICVAHVEYVNEFMQFQESNKLRMLPMSPSQLKPKKSREMVGTNCWLRTRDPVGEVCDLNSFDSNILHFCLFGFRKLVGEPVKSLVKTLACKKMKSISNPTGIA